MAVTIRGSGQVPVQVVTSDLTTATTASGGAWAATGLSATITPASSSNKILVLCHIGSAGMSSTSSVGFRIMRGATPVGVGSVNGSRLQISSKAVQISDTNHDGSCVMNYLDSPSTTSATTYTIEWYPQSGFTGYLNRNAAYSNDGSLFNATTASTLILLEVAYA
jgi:hypothetical protein